MKKLSFLTFILFASVTSPTFATVKLSKNGVCHDETSASFNKIKHFTTFNNLAECVNAGGKPTDGTSMTISNEGERYARDKFGLNWAPSTQNNHQDVLLSQSTGNLAFNEKGRLVKGRWASMYTGKILTSAANVGVDHIVPLQWAWEHGANKWTSEQRENFANDPRNIVVVEAALLLQKGEQGIDTWLPPKNQEKYKQRFNQLRSIYDLK